MGCTGIWQLIWAFLKHTFIQKNFVFHIFFEVQSLIISQTYKIARMLLWQSLISSWVYHPAARQTLASPSWTAGGNGSSQTSTKLSTSASPLWFKWRIFCHQMVNVKEFVFLWLYRLNCGEFTLQCTNYRHLMLRTSVKYSARSPVVHVSLTRTCSRWRIVSYGWTPASPRLQNKP